MPGMRVNTRLVASTRPSLSQPAGKVSFQSRGWGWPGSQHLHARTSHSLLAHSPLVPSRSLGGFCDVPSTSIISLSVADRVSEGPPVFHGFGQNVGVR